MDHVVAPLDSDHVTALDALVQGASEAAGLDPGPTLTEAHVTLLAYTGLDRDRAREAIWATVAGCQPFTVHAHGYGFFTGAISTDLSLHVPVVRAAALDAFHERLWQALVAAGGDAASWCSPELWTPHVTILDRTLDPDRLGAAASWLSTRHHPSWNLNVDRVALTGAWRERDRPGQTLMLGGADR